MRRPLIALLTVAAVASTAAAPASTATVGETSAGASVAEGTFPIGVCAWARPVSDGKFCVIVNDPRP